MQKGGKSEFGFTLIEVMVAAGLTSLVVLSMLSVVADYSKLFLNAQVNTTMMALRRQVIQNLNRRDAWTNTFLSGLNPQMNCLWNIYPEPYVKCAQVATDYNLVVLTRAVDGRSAVVLDSRVATSGFTRTGVPCSNFNAAATTPQARRCPIRLEVKWRLLHNGVDRDYFPTGYLPASYYPSAYWPGGGGGYWGYWWFGTIGAQVQVTGKFFLNEEEVGEKINVLNYGFKLFKSVP